MIEQRILTMTGMSGSGRKMAVGPHLLAIEDADRGTEQHQNRGEKPKQEDARKKHCRDGCGVARKPSREQSCHARCIHSRLGNAREPCRPSQRPQQQPDDAHTRRSGVADENDSDIRDRC
jgi:hypothetical protein